MELASLQAFVEVAARGSFSEAAQALFLTQPAISKRVAALEQELGARLFHRVGRQISPTQAGEALLPRARQLLAEAADLKRIASNLSGSISGTLLMGTSHHIGLHRLPPVLQAFRQRHPQVQLDIRFMDSEAACEDVAAGELELAVVTLPAAPIHNLLLEPVWHDPLQVVVSTEHPLAGRATVSLDDLSQHQAVLPGRGTYTRQILEHALIDSGAQLNTAMSTNYLETLKMLASINLGWTLLPSSMLDHSLRALAVPQLQLSRELGLVSHRRRTLSNSAQALRELCLRMGDARR